MQNFELFHQELNNLKLIFISYDYAISFTDICIKKYLDMLYTCKNVISLVLKKQPDCML